MGRLSNVTENPAVKTLKWKNRKMESVKDKNGKTVKNEDGTPKMKLVRETGWYYWDKTKEEEIMVEMPFSFIWLESATSFSGYSQNKSAGVYSNEVLNLKTDTMTVKCGDETIATGLYHSIKDKVKAEGGKFCIPVYAYLPDTEETVRLLMVGSSGSAWMNFHKQKQSQSMMISCIGANEKEMATGATYEEPAFKYIKMTDELSPIADEKAQEVADYFSFVLAKNKEINSESTTRSTSMQDVDNEDFDDINDM